MISYNECCEICKISPAILHFRDSNINLSIYVSPFWGLSCNLASCICKIARQPSKQTYIYRDSNINLSLYVSPFEGCLTILLTCILHLQDWKTALKADLQTYIYRESHNIPWINLSRASETSGTNNEGWFRKSHRTNELIMWFKEYPSLCWDFCLIHW